MAIIKTRGRGELADQKDLSYMDAGKDMCNFDLSLLDLRKPFDNQISCEIRISKCYIDNA